MDHIAPHRPQPNRRPHDRPAVCITGAARRIGAEMARRFGAAGWHVIIHHHHSHDDADALAATLPSAEVVSADLADLPSAVGLMRDLAGRLPDWRMLINCAAVFHYDGPDAIAPDTFAEAMRVNAEAPTRMAQTFLARARAEGGRRVVNLLDMKIANMNPDFFSYTMAKQALAAATTMLAMATRDGPVPGHARAQDRIYGLCPGAMLPSFDQQAAEHEISGRMNLLQRLTAPEELAQAALFLSEGWLASGSLLFVDSGQHLLAQPRDVLYLARQ